MGKGNAVRCDLNLKEKFEFVQSESSPPAPRIKVLLYHENLRESISTLATIDTGFDESLLLSRKLRDAIFKFAYPFDHDSLDAGGMEIPCERYQLKVKITGKWFDTVGYAPVIGDFENLIGRALTNKFNICLRGPSSIVQLAEKR